eukprot:5574035-Heterocapsa_arctica.AAC.1
MFSRSTSSSQRSRGRRQCARGRRVGRLVCLDRPHLGGRLCSLNASSSSITPGAYVGPPPSCLGCW